MYNDSLNRNECTKLTHSLVVYDVILRYRTKYLLWAYHQVVVNTLIEYQGLKRLSFLFLEILHHFPYFVSELTEQCHSSQLVEVVEPSFFLVVWDEKRAMLVI